MFSLTAQSHREKLCNIDDDNNDNAKDNLMTQGGVNINLALEIKTLGYDFTGVRQAHFYSTLPKREITSSLKISPLP